jgi:hypothetical protein
MPPDRQLARNGFDAGLKVRFLSVTIATGLIWNATGSTFKSACWMFERQVEAGIAAT